MAGGIRRFALRDFPIHGHVTFFPLFLPPLVVSAPPKLVMSPLLRKKMNKKSSRRQGFKMTLLTN